MEESLIQSYFCVTEPINTLGFKNVLKVTDQG